MTCMLNLSTPKNVLFHRVDLDRLHAGRVADTAVRAGNPVRASLGV